MLAVMSDGVTFSPDLFRGKAEYYDRFRLSYPDALISDLVRRTGASGQGRLLDLACGTGQLAFALRSSFAEVWAVDQEPDMVAVVAVKAAADPGAVPILPVVASAAELDAPPARFSVVVPALADHAAAFDDSLSAELGPYARDGRLTETVSFACELAVKGPSVAA
jgi:SAM-dependent methyltransferase